jgi:hypothetical protein
MCSSSAASHLQQIECKTASNQSVQSRKSYKVQSRGFACTFSDTVLRQVGLSLRRGHVCIPKEFQLFEVPARFQIFTGGVKVRRVGLVSFFVLNCYNCILGGRCRYFGQIPPTLEEYIPLDKVLVPAPAVNLGTVQDYGSTQKITAFLLRITY